MVSSGGWNERTLKKKGRCLVKNYLVIGAAGSIGQEVVRTLTADGHYVVAAVRHSTPEKIELKLKNLGAMIYVLNDVSHRPDVEECLMHFIGTRFDGIIYCVGHCPPGGFSEATTHPLLELPVNDLMKEFDMYQLGPLHIFQVMHRLVKDDGCFLFISSAITRLGNKWPSFLHAQYHAGMISALDFLVYGMRAALASQNRHISVHRVVPGAVDTPFHHGGPPIKLLPISRVVGAVLKALSSETSMDILLLPEES